MRAVELDREDIEEIMNALPKELRSKLVQMMTHSFSERSIERLKRFCAQYEEDCQIDGIIANTCGVLIDKIGSSLNHALDEKKKRGKCFNGLDAGRMVAQLLRDEAELIEESIKKGLDRERSECGHEHH